MTVAIIGTRGIPNNYGGFEQCAEYLSLGLVKRGFDVIVYNSHNHPYQENEWNGVKIIHCYDPEYKLGTAGQFIYDFNCIKDVRKRKCDVIIQLGYTSNSIWGWMLPHNSLVTTNMDGLEWKRSKYSKPVKNFLKFSEKLAVRYSDYLIADSIGIRDYLYKKYNRYADFIPYGAFMFDNQNVQALEEFNVEPCNYDMLIARLEPENSIEVILDGVVQAEVKRKFLVIGNHNNKYGAYLKKKYQLHKEIIFIGGIFDIKKLNNLRYFSNIYFHGHTVGGTNPSLLEAMACNTLICANDNIFNKFILEKDAVYFNDRNDVADHLTDVNRNSPCYQNMIANNVRKVAGTYHWDLIVDRYAQHIEEIILERNGKTSLVFPDIKVYQYLAAPKQHKTMSTV